MESLKLIESYYKDKKAKRSGVPYINHIYEGLSILNYMGVSEYIKDAFALHPIFQDDQTLETNFSFLNNNSISSYVMFYLMEYRNVANRGLSCYQVDNPDKIYLSPIKEVNQMLIADKVQNRKDFLKHHFGTHPQSIELDIYFKNWLRALKVTEKDYLFYCDLMKKPHSF